MQTARGASEIIRCAFLPPGNLLHIAIQVRFGEPEDPRLVGRWVVGGKGNGEARTPIQLALHGYLSPEARDESLRDGKAQARAPLGRAPANARVAVEQRTQSLLWDSRSVVAHADLDGAFLPFRRHVNVPAGRELECIPDEIDQDSPHSVSLRSHFEV